MRVFYVPILCLLVMRQFEVAIKILHVYFYQAMILHIFIIKPVVFPVFYWDEFHISIIFEKVNIVFKHDIVEFDSHFQPTHYWFIGFRSGNMSMFIIFYLLLYLCSLQPVEVKAIAERYQGESRESLLSQMPDDIQERIKNVGKRVPKETLNQLVIDMCTVRPLGMDELSLLLHRNAKSFKNKNIKILLESKKLFYWIPEMINHPQQKYIADPSMARSNSKKK